MASPALVKFSFLVISTLWPPFIGGNFKGPPQPTQPYFPDCICGWAIHPTKIELHLLNGGGEASSVQANCLAYVRPVFGLSCAMNIDAGAGRRSDPMDALEPS